MLELVLTYFLVGTSCENWLSKVIFKSFKFKTNI